MRIESVTAHAFGPFVDETLDLARGMTVIYGPNESGKSTWHAALYAGLCGMRRGRGQQKPDRDFTDQHRPWDGGDWEVSEIVKLQDGRRIELRHDLNGKVDCSARDVDLGKDYSNEIIHDGAPDGARWLGLDRKSFLSTACVRQADIQSVIEQASALQDELQRAAATAGADSTAAAALSRLEGFLGENVGLDRANSTRPLRTAKNRRERAQQRLEDAREAHADYLRQLEEVEQLQGQLADAERSLQLVEAAHVRDQAEQWVRNLGSVRELTARHPEEPPAETESREAGEGIRIALDRWENRPDAVELQGLSAEELKNELAKLPPMPQGETRPDADVVNAKNGFLIVGSNLERHRQDKPGEPLVVDAGGLDTAELRKLAAEIVLEEPAIDPQVQERVNRARQKAEDTGLATVRTRQSQQARHIPLLIRPVVVLVRGILSVVRTLFRRADQAARLEALQELREAEVQLGEVKFRLDEVSGRRREAIDKIILHGVSSDPEELVLLAQQAEQAQQSRGEMTRWETEGERRREEFDKAEGLLWEALRSRGVVNASSANSALERYERECSDRERLAIEASRKLDLQRAYEARKREEVLAADSERRRLDASKQLRDAAEAIGVTGDLEDEVAAQLRSWLIGYDQSTIARELARQEWNELQALLNGGTLQDLEEAAAKRRDQAAQLAHGLGPEEIGRVALEKDVEARLSRLRDDCSNARSALAERQGSVEQYARNMASVPEAEEELAGADAELARIIALDRTLTKTQEFLKHAQDKVHRTVAPLLRDAIRPWLQVVTGGRYTDIRIDVESLMVHVSGDGRNWRQVPLLSHGTSEQIYLLLRVAMARHLTRQGEICPLILDDVTVNCDPVRQIEILNLLHAISEEQQIILFSQEPEVRQWAQQQLSESRDRLVELPLSAIPP